MNSHHTRLEFVVIDELPSGFSEVLQKDDSKKKLPLSREELLERNEAEDRRCLDQEREHVEMTDAIKVLFSLENVSHLLHNF